MTINLLSAKSIYRFNLFVLVLITLVFSANNLYAQEIVCTTLDDFENSTMVGNSGVELTPGNPGPLEILDDGSPGVLGSIRDITFGPLVGGLGASIEVLNIPGLEGFSLSNRPGSRSSASILYNAEGEGLNINLSTTTFIRMTIESNDLPDTAGNITLSDSSNSSTFSMPNLPNGEQGASFPVELEYPFNAFPQIQDLDLTNIQSIEVELIPTNTSSDTRISLIEFCGLPLPPDPKPIPTISEWGLIATAAVLGFMAVVFMRKRKLTV